MEYIAWIILGIVAGGVFYAFTAKDSLIKQQMDETPLMMKSIGLVFLGVAIFIIYKLAKSEYDGAAWLPAIGICLILAVAFLINFGNNHHQQ